MKVKPFFCYIEDQFESNVNHFCLEFRDLENRLLRRNKPARITFSGHDYYCHGTYWIPATNGKFFALSNFSTLLEFPEE